MTALELAGKIVSCIDAKKGEDIKLLADDVWEMDGGRLERIG